MYLTLHFMYLPYAGSMDGVHVAYVVTLPYYVSSLAFYVRRVQMYRDFDL